MSRDSSAGSQDPPNTLILGSQYGISDIDMTTTEQIQTKTEFGLPIDESFAKPASEERIQKAASALRAHNFAVEVVDTPAQARAYVNSILPKDQSILTASSETVRLWASSTTSTGRASSTPSCRSWRRWTGTPRGPR